MAAFTINGEACAPDVGDAVMLLDVLRSELGLAGPRFGCGAGQCGACMVLLDDAAVPSCNTPLWAVAGRSVVTIEGLGTPEQPHRLQTAFLAAQAGQCGYCLPGVIVSAAGLLRRQQDPDEAAVRAALDRNLCRCGAHNRMVRAVLAAARAP